MTDNFISRIPFTHHGKAGQIEVHYKSNNDPVKTGFDILKNLNFELHESLGYPTMHAKIIDYQGTGYRTSFAWIQVVTTYCQSSEPIENKYIDVDVAPDLYNLGIPFYSFGNLPEIFDAPCHNIGSNLRLKWVADTFLTTMPDRSNNETISYLAGFKWGYVEHRSTDNLPVVILPLEITDGASWNHCLELLRDQFNLNPRFFITWEVYKSSEDAGFH